MKWKKGREKDGKESDWFIISDKDYRIAKYMIFKTPKYTAFAPRINGQPQPIGTSEDSASLRKLCEEHYESRKISEIPG